MLICLSFTLIFKQIMDYILTSKFGFVLRALGDNEQIVNSLGIDSNKIKILGLMLANALVAISGSIFTQYIRIIDLSTSVGTMVVGLASIIFGMGLIKKSRIINYISIIIIGSIIYYNIINFALNSSSIIEVKPTDVKIITAMLLALILGLEHKKKKVK